MSKKREWSGLQGTDDAWRVEAEYDVFDGARGYVVSLYVENARPTEKIECGLAELTAEDARELAAALLEEADTVDRNNAARTAA
jgi:hypothetical protein